MGDSATKTRQKYRLNRISLTLGFVGLGVFTVASLLPELVTERYGYPSYAATVPFGELLLRAAGVSNGIAFAVAAAILLHSMSFLGSTRLYKGFPSDGAVSQVGIWVPYIAAWLLSAGFGAVQGAAGYALLCVAMTGATSFLLNRDVVQSHLDKAVRWPIRAVISLSLLSGFMFPGRAFAPYEVWPGGWFQGVDRLQGILPHPNTLAWLAALAIVVEIFGPRAKSSTIFALAGLTALLLSGSRTASISLFVGLMAAVIFRGSSNTGFKLLSRTLTPVLILLGVVTAGALGVSTQTFNGRQETWIAAWEAFSESWLLGSGPAAYLVTDGTVANVPYAHNQLLQTAAELGSIGLLGLAVHVMLLVRYIRAANSALGYCLLAMWLAMFVSENLLRFAATSFFCQIFFFQLSLHLVTRSKPVGTRRASLGRD